MSDPIQDAKESVAAADDALSAAEYAMEHHCTVAGIEKAEHDLANAKEAAQAAKGRILEALKALTGELGDLDYMIGEMELYENQLCAHLNG